MGSPAVVAPLDACTRMCHLPTSRAPSIFRSASIVIIVPPPRSRVANASPPAQRDATAESVPAAATCIDAVRADRRADRSTLPFGPRSIRSACAWHQGPVRRAKRRNSAFITSSPGASVYTPICGLRKRVSVNLRGKQRGVPYGTPLTLRCSGIVPPLSRYAPVTVIAMECVTH